MDEGLQNVVLSTVAAYSKPVDLPHLLKEIYFKTGIEEKQIKSEILRLAFSGDLATDSQFKVVCVQRKT
jgi:DNA-directed RNA polymerase delta subunit